MGPNGTGKSTLASVIAGKEIFDVTEGSIEYKNKNLFDLSVEDRAREGIYIGFQISSRNPRCEYFQFYENSLK
jgi:Fe-S cluster assembly ATP-binding protein